MKKEIDTRIVIAVIAVLVVAVGIFGWRMFAPRGGGNNLTPQEAGLGKPVFPSGGQGQLPNTAPSSP
jgi:hypothetical protein